MSDQEEKTKDDSPESKPFKPSNTPLPKDRRVYRQVTPPPVDENGNYIPYPGQPWRRIDGKFMTKAPTSKLFTKENASEIAKIRKEKYRKAAAKAILEEARAINPRAVLPSDAWGMLVGNQFVKILDSDKPNADASEFIGKAIGAVLSRQEQEQSAAPPGLPPELLANADRLILIIERAKEIERGEVIDVSARTD